MPIPAAAQTTDRPGDTTAILVGFSYNYDTYVWSDSVQFRRRLGQQTVWGLDGGLSATQISSSDGIERKQRFLSGRAFIDHKFSSRWTAGISLTQRRHRLEELANRHFVFSDALMELKYSWSPSSWVAQKTGFSVAGRSAGGVSTEDAGFTTETAAHFETRRWRDRLWRIYGSLKINKLQNVPSVEGHWGGVTSGEFASGDTLDLSFNDHYRQTRYYPSATNYQTIAEQRLRQGNFLATASGGWGTDLRWGISTDYIWRRERYGMVTSGNSLNAVLPMGLRQSSRGYQLNLGRRFGVLGGLNVAYGYNETDEDFGADVKDQDSQTGELELDGYFTPGTSDSLVVRALWKVVSFFIPPDTAFYTDRDLATRLAEIAWFHRYTPAWSMRISFSYRGLRQVFVSGLWSGNNNHNDIYLFAPCLNWQPAPGWSINQTYRIQANYLSYDIEKGQPQPERSTLYRRGESETRMSLMPLAHSAIELRYTYRYEDFGPLIWREKWNQQVSWDRRSHLAGITWRARPHAAWEVAPGLYFEQKRAYNHKEEDQKAVRVPRSTFVRRMIRLAATWRPASGRDDLHISGSRRIQRSSSGPKDVSDWVELTYRRHW